MIVIMKARTHLLRCSKGFTLVEMISALLILSIIMIAVFTFTTYAADSTMVAHSRSSTQNEMRLMMTYIKTEVTAAMNGSIMDDAPLDRLAAVDPNTSRLVFSFDENNPDCFGIAMRVYGEPNIVRMIDFAPMPNLEVNFRLKDNNFRILVVTLTNNDPDSRLCFELQDEIFMPNIRTTSKNEDQCPWWVHDPDPCDCAPLADVNRRLVLSPPGGGNSLIITTRNLPG